MRKTAIPSLVAILCWAGFYLAQLQAEPQLSQTITVTAGTAIRLSAGNIRVNSFSVQMGAGGTGLGYLLYAQPATTCATATAGHLVAQMGAAASATQPGQQILVDRKDLGGTDLRRWCVDGSVNGDTIILSYDVKN